MKTRLINFLIVVLTTFVSGHLFSQAPTRAQLQPINARYQWESGGFKNVMYLPLDTSANAEVGALAYKSGKPYVKDTLRWNLLTAGGSVVADNMANHNLSLSGDRTHNGMNHYFILDTLAYLQYMVYRDDPFLGNKYYSKFYLDSTINGFPFRFISALRNASNTGDSIHTQIGTNQNGAFIYNYGDNGNRLGNFQFLGNDDSARFDIYLSSNLKSSHLSFGRTAYWLPADSSRWQLMGASSAPKIIGLRAQAGDVYTPVAIDMGNFITKLHGSVIAEGPGDAPATLNATGVVPGPYTNPSVTINSEGRVTSAVNGSNVISDPKIGEYYGKIYRKSSWTNLNDFTVNGATASIVSNAINISGGTNDFTKTIDLDYYTLLNRWKEVIGFHVLDNNSTSYGIGIGLNGTNAWTGHQHDIIASINLTNTGSSGFLTLSNNVGNGTYNTVAVSTQNLIFSVGDALELGIERRLDSVYAYVKNLTNPNSLLVSYKWLTTNSTNPIPNTGKFAVYALGGNQKIDSLSITSKSIKNADIAILGDSKSVYYANLYNRLFGQRLGQYFTCELIAGPGDRTPELITRLPELKAISPKQVLIQEFSNDLRSGMSFSQSIANINLIIDSLTKWGINYYFIPFFETSLDLSQWNSYFLTNYPNHYIDTWGLFQSGFLQDGVHPTDAAQDTLTKIILNSFALKGGNNKLDLFAGKIGSEIINGTPGSILFIDNKNNLSENNSKLFWDYNSNRLGIGTTSPTTPINVVGGITADTVYGGSTATDSLRLMSTAHATKGKILFGTSAYNEASNRLGIGTTNPSGFIDIRTASDASNGIEITNTDISGVSSGSRLLLWNNSRTAIGQVLLGNSTSAFSPNGLIINTSAGKVSLASLSDDITFGKSTTINGSNEHARFKFNGNFLIGTTTDNSYKLQVNGAISTVTDSGVAKNTAWIDTDGKIRKGALLSGSNFANADLNFTGDRTHNGKSHAFGIDSLSSYYWLSRSTSGGVKTRGLLSFDPSGNSFLISNIVRKADNTGDSLNVNINTFSSGEFLSLNAANSAGRSSSIALYSSGTKSYTQFISDSINMQSPIRVTDTVYMAGGFDISNNTRSLTVAPVSALTSAIIHNWAQTADATVANTTAETTLLGTGSGSLTILPKEWAVGKTFTVTLYGTLGVDVGNPGTTTFRTKLGSVNLCATSGIFQGSVVSDRHFQLTVTFTCRSTGATGTVFAQGQYRDANSSINVFNNSNATATIDMTANQTFDLTLQWSQAAANNTATSFVTLFKSEN